MNRYCARNFEFNLHDTNNNILNQGSYFIRSINCVGEIWKAKIARSEGEEEKEKQREKWKQWGVRQYWFRSALMKWEMIDAKNENNRPPLKNDEVAPVVLALVRCWMKNPIWDDELQSRINFIEITDSDCISETPIWMIRD